MPKAPLGLKAGHHPFPADRAPGAKDPVALVKGDSLPDQLLCRDHLHGHRALGRTAEGAAPGAGLPLVRENSQGGARHREVFDGEAA